MVRLLAEQFEIKSNVKVGRVSTQFQASYVSSHTEELWYNETVCLWMTIYIRSPWVLSTLAKEFAAATRIMQSSSNELSSLVSGNAKMWTNEGCFIMPYNSQVDVVRMLAERFDTKSNVKIWAGFDPSFKRPTCLATLKSCDTTKQSACGWQYIYNVSW